MYNGTQSIETRVKQVLTEEFGLEGEIKNDANVMYDFGADSLDLVEALMALEDEFHLEIPDEAAEKYTTVQSVIDSVTDLLDK
jgi:acyl carrier protein